MSTKPKKCEPLSCSRFLQRYERTWDKVPADIHVVRCPFRVKGKAECGYREGQDLVGGPRRQHKKVAA